VQACPHDNVGVISRLPADERVRDPLRSGLGVLSRRTDLAALVIVFAFGALLNAFGMVSPVYVLEQRLAKLFGVTIELPVLAFIFALFLLVEPLLLLGVAAWITRSVSSNKRSLLATAVRYAYALVPLGFGIWLAHYSFHFLTGVFTFIPVTQAAAADLGAAILGQPRWGLTGMAPNVVQLFEFGFIALGLLGSLLVSYSIAATEELVHPVRVFVPWAVLSLLLAAAALWLLVQPMEMRGVVLGSG
jgi:hypothetical protein